MLRLWGAYIWRSLYIKGLIFRILWYSFLHYCCCSGKNLVPQEALSLPPDWQQQIENVQLISVRPGSAEWEHVQRSLKRSLREAQVTNVQRVQNKWLYRKYAIQRHLIKDKNG